MMAIVCAAALIAVIVWETVFERRELQTRNRSPGGSKAVDAQLVQRHIADAHELRRLADEIRAPIRTESHSTGTR